MMIDECKSTFKGNLIKLVRLNYALTVKSPKKRALFSWQRFQIHLKSNTKLERYHTNKHINELKTEVD